VLKRAGLIDGGVVPLSTALRNDEPGYMSALTDCPRHRQSPQSPLCQADDILTLLAFGAWYVVSPDRPSGRALVALTSAETADRSR